MAKFKPKLVTDHNLYFEEMVSIVLGNRGYTVRRSQIVGGDIVIPFEKDNRAAYVTASAYEIEENAKSSREAFTLLVQRSIRKALIAMEIRP